MMTVKQFVPVLLFAFSLSAVAQHDPGRAAVRLLAKGQAENAIQAAGKTPKKQNSPISAAEHAFVLAMANSQKGDIVAAVESAEKALQLGLPIERFAAGPREIFEPLYADAAFSKRLKDECSPLLHGPLLGSVTDRSASFWVRTLAEADVKVVVGSFSANVRTQAAKDYAAVAAVTELKPNTKYSYHIEINGKQVGNTHEFTTFPKVGKTVPFKIAFGGGAGFTPQYERMWKTISGHNVDALLLLGDNVYIDDPEYTMTDRYCYYRRQSQPDWRKLTASTSVFSIYDDHDFGLNDCNPGPKIETPSWKRPVWEVFAQNWNNPAYGGGAQQPGCWYDFQIGDVHFIMLDCRYYRDLKGGSMLGLVQKKWMFQTLEKSTGTFKVLVSSVPWAPGVKPGSKDTWDGFSDEREEIFSFFETQSIEGVVLMSADRHRTDLRKIPRPNGYDLSEVMSSRLTNVHTHGLMENAKGSEFIMGYNETPSFGMMEFDTTASDPQVVFNMISIDNENKGSRIIKLSELSL